MNSVILMGRLTADPEVRYNKDGDAFGSYTLAVDRRYKKDGGQETDFIRCVMFGKTAEFAEKWLKKGTRMIVRGRIQTGSYTNREGKKVYTTDVVVEEQEFAQTKAEAQGEKGQPAAQKETDDGPADKDGFMDIPDGIDEQLPFN